MTIPTKEKVGTPYVLIACIAPYWWSNLKCPITDINWKRIFPLLHAEFFQLCDVQGVSCMHCLFQITPRQLNRIKSLAFTWPFLNSPFLSFDTFFCEFTGMSLSRCMVQIHFCLSFWTDDLISFSSTLWSIHKAFYDGEPDRSSCSKTVPNHDISTPMLYSWYEVFVLIACTCTVTVPKLFNSSMANFGLVLMFVCLFCIPSIKI